MMDSELIFLRGLLSGNSQSPNAAAISEPLMFDPCEMSREIIERNEEIAFSA